MRTTQQSRPVIFSGIKPTGHLTVGNYLGAIRRFVPLQDEASCLFPIVNLHGLTVTHEPDRLRALTREAAGLCIASGLDPERCLLFRQSDVAAHTELSYLLESVGYVGELNRMIQFKEKGRGQPRTRVSLYTYPVLMAADIVCYRTDAVPVGDDQRQHLELARTLAERFNRDYGAVFTVPEMLDADLGGRVMDLQSPTTKMSKDAGDDSPGVLRLLDPPEVVRAKVLRAVTDSGAEVSYAPERKPGVSNLVEIMATVTDRADLEAVAADYRSYGALKHDVAEAVIALLEPIQKRYADLAADPATIDRVLADAATRARALAAPTLAAAKNAIGV